MKKNLYIIIPAILLLTITLCAAAADTARHQLANKLLRLHVLANSDSAEDQELKLKVRDRVIECAADFTKEAESVGQAQELIIANIETLYTEAREEILKNGYSYPVKIELSDHFFPTRDYDTFSLPAGQYRALRIIIGDGAGKNWWCVVFPPLCLSASEADFEESADSAGLTEEERALIQSGKTVYRMKFKTIELIGQLADYFKA